MAEGNHAYPSRTRTLSLPAPMVLGPQGPGRVGRRQADPLWGLFLRRITEMFHGEVPKWSKGADSKSARRREACVGSNPTFSAICFPNGMGFNLATVAKWLTHRFVDPTFGGSIPLGRPIHPLGISQAVRQRTLTPSFPGSIPGSPASYARTWLSGRASPCQGEGRGFESHRPLQHHKTDNASESTRRSQAFFNWIQECPVVSDREGKGSRSAPFFASILSNPRAAHPTSRSGSCNG